MSGYDAARLARVRELALEEAASRPAKGEMRGGDGVLTRRIPREAFFNAVVGHGVDPNDTEYWSDMERLYPEIGVKYEPSRVVSTGTAGAPVAAGRIGRKTRFGRVTWSKTYA